MIGAAGFVDVVEWRVDVGEYAVILLLDEQDDDAGK